MDIEGDKFAFIYPEENIANVYTVKKSCPVKVSEPVTVPDTDLTGWCAIPRDQCTRYRREFESRCD